MFPVQVDGSSVSCVDGLCCSEHAIARSAPGLLSGYDREAEYGPDDCQPEPDLSVSVGRRPDRHIKSFRNCTFPLYHHVFSAITWFGCRQWLTLYFASRRTRKLRVLCNLEPPGADLLHECVKILFVLHGIAARKLGDGAIEGLALAQVSCDRDGIAASSVSACQCPAAKIRGTVQLLLIQVLDVERNLSSP